MKKLLLLNIIMILVIGVSGQEKYKAPDMPVFAIKTNALYWATATPNLGVEFALSEKWTMDISGNYNPWKWSGNKKFKHWLVQPELRYWLCDRFSGHFFGVHAFYAQFNMCGIEAFGWKHKRYQGDCSGVVSLTGITGYWVTVGVWKELLAWGMPISNMTSINVRSVVPSLKTGDGITWDPRN